VSLLRDVHNAPLLNLRIRIPELKLIIRKGSSSQKSLDPSRQNVGMINATLVRVSINTTKAMVGLSSVARPL